MIHNRRRGTLLVVATVIVGTLSWSGHPLALQVVKIDGKKVAPLICYELLIIWPALQSMWHDSDVIIAVGNGWWTEGTGIVAIERACIIAWAKQFGKPVVMAFNT